MNNVIPASLRMTVETGNAVVGISLHIRVLIVHVGLVVFMAVDTTEKSVIPGIRVAVGTTVPLSFVFA